jgi:preprotein translocase subunit SecF
LIYTTIRFEFNIGIAAIAALVHDLLIMVSFYAVFQVQVNNSFIAAILTILGYSINDTIVIFDRIRENKGLGKYHDTTTLVNTSVTQSISRSINTAITTLTTITCLYIIGVPAVQEFALPLMIGVVSGAYSTIFIASPVWMLLEKRKKARIHA